MGVSFSQIDVPDSDCSSRRAAERNERKDFLLTVTVT
jgi:hypothetical protein